VPNIMHIKSIESFKKWAVQGSSSVFLRHNSILYSLCTVQSVSTKCCWILLSGLVPQL